MVDAEKHQTTMGFKLETFVILEFVLQLFSSFYNHRLVSLVDKVPVYHAGGLGSIPSQTMQHSGS